MARTFHIIGDYGLTSQTELETDTSSQDAIRWLKGYCRRDTGGYETVEVIEFATDGEALVHYTIRAHDDD